MEGVALVLEKVERVFVRMNMKVTKYMISEPSLTERLRELLENEARSCSMDFGCITPLYAYRMFGGQYSIEDIENGFTELRKEGSGLRFPQK